MKNKIFLVLDIGTSYLKCGIVDAEHHIVARHQREFPMIREQAAFEIDFSAFFDTTAALLRECLSEDVVKRSGVEALLITSQAQTFAPVDADFQPLRRGIVWLDERATEEAAWLQERVPDFAAAAGFVRPLPALYVSKLLWLMRHEPSVFNKARAFPLINEYLVYKLTGELYTDSTGFGMGGMYDFRRNDLNSKILQILGLTKDFFPKVEKAAARGERISEQIRQDWQLSEYFPVFLCGNDQGASACGAGLSQPGDVNINFGTAMVIYMVTESLSTNLNEKQIAGKHPLDNWFFLLHYESDFGIQIRRLKEAFFKDQTYDELFQTFRRYPRAGARKDFRDDEAAALSKADSHRLCAGLIRYYLNQLSANLDQIRQIAGIKNISISGGMAQSKVLLDILRDILPRPFTVNNSADAGLFGAIDIYLHSKNRRNSHG